MQERSYAAASAGLLESYPRDRAMDASRLAAFLDGRRYAVLATSRPDGRPQAAPVAFVVADGAFWFASVAGARVRNLRARPYAAVVVMEGEGETHRAVIAEGPVTVYEAAGHDRDEGDPQVRRFLAEWTRRRGAVPAWAAAFIALRPQRLFSYDATLSA